MADHNFAFPSLLQTYAMNLIELGKFEEAAPINRESLQLFQALGDRYGMADCLANMARLAMLQGDLAQARKLLLEVMTPAKTLNLHLIQRRWQPFLGIVTLYCGDGPEAQRLLQESLQLCLESKNRVFLARIYAYLAETALWDGELDQAEQWLAKSLEFHPAPQANSIYEIERLWVAARLSTKRQQYGRAATLFGLAEQMCRYLHYVSAGPMAAPVDAALATVQAALGQALFVEAFSAGKQLSLDVAFATLLTPELLLWRMSNEDVQG
jgi:tetratricopeptide (TPR) repeat protein